MNDGTVWKIWKRSAVERGNVVGVVSAKLKEANGKEIKFEEVVEKAKQAAVLVLVY